LESENRRSTQLGSVEVLMDDRVSPFVQIIEPSLSCRVVGRVVLDFGPEIHSEPSEVRTNTTRLCIASIQLAAHQVLGPNNRLKKSRRDCVHHVIDALSMEIAAESLKVRREQDGVSPIDLLGRVTSSPSRSTDYGMRLGHLVEGGRSGRDPLPVRG
jgi:hypothetical protein